MTIRIETIMTEPVCVQTKPFATKLEPGNYFWCACGLSSKQPFCDGSHAGTGLLPKRFSVAQQETRYLCGCKASKGAPFCDGTHKQLTV